MSHRVYLCVVSLSFASAGLFLASLTLHATGCDEGARSMFDSEGICGASPDGGSSSGCFCSTLADCPATTECMVWRCDDGRCKADPPTDPPPVLPQHPGDCKRDECVAGEKTTIDDSTDLPTNNNACVDVTCAGGEPHYASKSAGAACSEGQNVICNGMGSCVRCLETTNGGCGAGDVCHELPGGELQCVPHCVDGVKNADETDTDCGGTCGPCDLGHSCTKDSDCSGGHCAPGNVCCNMACTGACTNCTQNFGKCHYLLTGKTDANCNTDKACLDGVGCVGMQGAACFLGDDCMSKSCMPAGMPAVLVCSPGLPGAPCVTTGDCLNPGCANNICP